MKKLLIILGFFISVNVYAQDDSFKEVFESFDADKVEDYFETVETIETSEADNSIWRHVYNPHRFKLLNKKQVIFIGTVDKIRKETYDADYHINLIPDQTYVHMLDEGNYTHQEGCMVIEIICAYRFGKRHSKEAKKCCKGYTNTLEIPKKGDRIKVMGYFVSDGHHGWNEIHPVTRLEVLD